MRLRDKWFLGVIGSFPVSPETRTNEPVTGSSRRSSALLGGAHFLDGWSQAAAAGVGASRARARVLRGWLLAVRPEVALPASFPFLLLSSCPFSFAQNDTIWIAMKTVRCRPLSVGLDPHATFGFV